MTDEIETKSRVCLKCVSAYPEEKTIIEQAEGEGSIEETGIVYKCPICHTTGKNVSIDKVINYPEIKEKLQKLDVRR